PGLLQGLLGLACLLLAAARDQPRVRFALCATIGVAACGDLAAASPAVVDAVEQAILPAGAPAPAADRLTSRGPDRLRAGQGLGQWVARAYPCAPWGALSKGGGSNASNGLRDAGRSGAGGRCCPLCPDPCRGRIEHQYWLAHL